MVAVRPSDGEVMEAREACEVRRRNEAAPRDIAEVRRKLRPEGRLQRHVLAHGGDAQIGEQRDHFGHMAIEPLKIVRMDRDGRMMLAEPCAPCRDLVLGQPKLVAQGYRLVLCRTHPAQRQVHPPQRLAPFDEGEALAHRHFERQARQLVEHPRHGERGPVLDRNQRDEAPLQMPRRRQLHRVAPEANAPRGQVMADIAMRDDHGPHRAVDEIGQEFERFGPHPVRAFIRAEQARIVGAQRRDQRVARIVERLLLARDQRRIALGRAGEPAAHPVRNPDPALQGAAHDRQEQLVDVELLARQPRAPALVEPLRELIRKGPI